MHDGAVGLDWSSRDIVAVLEVDDDDFGGCGLVLLLSNADVVVGFECLEGDGDNVSCCFRDAKRAGQLALGVEMGLEEQQQRSSQYGRTHELKPIAA